MSRRRLPSPVPAPLAVLLLALVGSLAGCSDAEPIAPVDLRLTLETPVEPVAPGAGFPLTVVRVWRRTLTPAPFSERALLPLTVRLDERTERSDGERTEERLRYTAFALSLRDVVVKAPRLTAKPADGGPERSVSAQSLRIRVAPALAPEAPGPLEAPTLPPPAVRRPQALLLGLLGAFLGLAAAYLVRRRRARAAPPPAPPAPAPQPPPPPGPVALAALEALRPGPGAGTVEHGQCVAGAAEVLRAYVAARFGAPAREQTTPEILAAPWAAAPLAEPAREALARVLRLADLVKFAAHAPSAPQAADALEASVRFVRATSEGAA